MNFNDFQRIVRSFADNESDVIVQKNKILTVIRGEAIEVKIEDRDGVLMVDENDCLTKPLTWISTRLACLHQLADRIIDYTPETKSFISPTGRFLGDVEIDPSETEIHVTDIPSSLISNLSNRILGTSKVVYLISDAGEGKTTLINHIARKQAIEYKQRNAKWLLVPIPLGGRPFLRFDDIVIASLVNRLRFRAFYYESFIELIKLGLIVPAFDGFEEMFMEGSTGEALSATGQLMNKLDSSGSILIAARQAYFDYKSFSSQAKLYDTIGTNSVSFSKLAINRWNTDQFLMYARQRGIQHPAEIYDFVSTRLGTQEHPLLTRAVLVNQLLDVIHNTEDLSLIANSLDSTTYYFPKFVDAIIKREAELKWIDRSGEPFKPLLTVLQHYEILSLLAEEMWLNSTDALPEGVLDLISEIYCETQSMPSYFTRQVKERLKQHALIIKAETGNNHFRFDHEEFKEFFLGVALYHKFIQGRKLDIKNVLRKGSLYKQTIDTLVAYIKGGEVNVTDIIQMLITIQQGEGPASFIRENNGGLLIRIIDGHSLESLEIENFIFPINCMHGVNIRNIIFKNSYFQATSVRGSVLSECRFINCTFEKIEFNHDHQFENVNFQDCEVASVQDVNKENTYYDPWHIEVELRRMGILSTSELPLPDNKTMNEAVADEDLELMEKALRRFLRSTYINDSIFKMRLGGKADYFFKEILPSLIEKNIIKEVDYVGSGQKRRFKLGVPFESINEALIACRGDYNVFLTKF